MSFADYWYRKQRANRSLNDADAKMTISVEAFRKEIQKAFDAGKAEGFTEANGSKSEFEKIFGKGFL